MSHSQIIKAIDLVKSGNNGLAVTILENVRDELSNPDYVEEKIAHTIANT